MAQTARLERGAAEEEWTPWFVRLARRLRPPEGWPVFGAAWLAVLCLPAAAVDAQWLAGLDAAFWLATLAFLLAWRLGHVRRLPGVPAAGVLVLGGVLSDLVWGVYVLNLGQLWLGAGQALRYLAWWLDLRRLPAFEPLVGPALSRALQQAPVPPLDILAGQWGSAVEFGQRVAWWVGGLLGSRSPVPDNLVVSGLALLAIWLAAAFAGWYITRRGRPFAALLPALALVIVQTFLANRGLPYLWGMLSLCPLLLALSRYSWLARRWDAEGTDYSTELKFGVALAGAAVTMLVMCITPVLPFITSRQAADAFWRLFEKPYRQVEQRVNASFPAAPGAPSLVPAGGVAAGGLPRSHLLGGKPELGRQVALRVTVRGARPNDILYWRGQTFSVYDGRGWETDSGAAQLERLQAGQPWFTEQLAARHTILSFVDVYAATIGVLYGPGEPISADRPYQALTRFPGDLVQLQAPGGPDTYTILSAVPDENPNALRAAGTAYPPQVSSLYLKLPANLPREVAAYAAQITAGAATPYDAAVAIERTLRQIPYSLDVPTPPAGRELVSWFLFDLKRGYCDYYATAMVVLARARGIPARLAVGYSTGSMQDGKYQVTELQAHSWPELYFPKIGWVPFEPTAYQPAPQRVPGDVPTSLFAGGPPPRLSAPELGELRQRGEAYAAQAALYARLGRLLAALNGLLAAWTAWRLLRPGQLVTAGGPGRDYLRLAGWGRRLGRPALATETPREYAAALAELAGTAAERARLDRDSARRAAEVARAGAARLAHDLEVAEYAGGAGRPDPAARRAAPLWAALRRLWLARWWHV